MWCYSARRSDSGGRCKVSRAAAWGLLFGIWPVITAPAQEAPRILQAIENARDAVTSLDVRIEVVDMKAVQADPGNPLTRGERFAFKGDDRLREQTQRGGGRDIPTVSRSLLGGHGFQQMTGGDFKVFGSRTKCPEATFSHTTFEEVVGWEVPDPTIRSDKMRAFVALTSLPSALRHASSTASTEGGLITLKGTIDGAELIKELFPEDPPGPTALAYEIVLDPTKGYALVSRRNWKPGVEGEFHAMRNLDFREIPPGVWAPTKGEFETVEKGKVSVKKTWKVVSIRVNDIDDSVFNQKLIPRSTFVDLDHGKREPETGSRLVELVADGERTIESIADGGNTAVR